MAMMNEFWIHPALILIVGAILVPLMRGRARSVWLLLVPALVFARVVSMGADPGIHGVVKFLDLTLTFGRVDKLGQVFGYIMSLMCLFGSLYALHVKESAQHSAAWVYVAGSLGVIYAGDFMTLFLFWEMMAFSSVFLIWLRRRPQSLGAGFRYLLVHVAVAGAIGGYPFAVSRHRR